MTTEFVLLCDRNGCETEERNDGHTPDSWGRPPLSEDGRQYGDLCPDCYQEYKRKLGEFNPEVEEE